MVRGARYAYALLAWLFVIGLVIQVFLAGVGIFGDDDVLATHADLGWILHLSPILILVAGAVGRVGASALLWTAALFVVMFIQPILATFRADLPAVAALHPVVALVVFWLAITVALRAARSIGADTGSPTPASSGAAS